MSSIEIFIPALAGGICIGIASVMLMILTGRIAGISGITFNAIISPLKNFWAVAFVIGLPVGAGIYQLLMNQIPSFSVPLPLLLAGGFIVGLGTKIGSGCTSGHGICGIGRLSARSIVATCIFITAGVVTVFIRLHIAGSGL